MAHQGAHIARTTRASPLYRCVIRHAGDPAVIRRILEHLGRWAPRAMRRSPPPGPEAWPVHASLPLTYHPLPDIA